MDPAFRPLPDLVPELLPHIPDIVDEGAGVRTSVTGYELSTPVELDIVVDRNGAVALGAAPPLYHLETTWMPVFHQIRLATGPRAQDTP